MEESGPKFDFSRISLFNSHIAETWRTYTCKSNKIERNLIFLWSVELVNQTIPTFCLNRPWLLLGLTNSAHLWSQHIPRQQYFISFKLNPNLPLKVSVEALLVHSQWARVAIWYLRAPRDFSEKRPIYLKRHKRRNNGSNSKFQITNKISRFC